jgi:glutathione S-transferase
MLSLYYAPGAISFAPHMVLYELGIEHTAERLVTADDAHRTPAFMKINPLGRLPALVLDDGRVLTETAAILQYLAAVQPEPSLVPSDPWLRARCGEWLSLIGTSLQPTYAFILRPDRVVADATTHAPLQAAARARFMELLQHCEARVPNDGFLIGDYSVADPYLLVMVLWARFIGVPFDGLPRLNAWFGRVAQRPAFLRTLRAEGLVDAAGKPTPPARV